MTRRGATGRGVSGHGRTAAHSPATAAAGARILEDGGSAADAAVAMTLAACVGEPLVVSLLSGMHGIHGSPDGRVLAVDGFVDVPAITTGGHTVQTEVVFAEETVPYTVGASTFGVPGLVAGCGLLHQREGRMPWARLVEPALDVARTGVVLTPENAVLLDMIKPVMTMNTGAEVFCHPDGRLKTAGDQITLPDVTPLLEVLGSEGPTSMQHGEIAHALARFCNEVGSPMTTDDLASFRAVAHRPPLVEVFGHRVHSRVGLSPLLTYLDNLSVHPPDDVDVATLAEVQSMSGRKSTGTTSLAAVDADGNVCAVTASLGLGTGDWFHGCQLNSMLGEADLQQGPLRPRTRMGSMMAPTVIAAPDGTLTALGAAGGSRIPSAVLRVVDGMTRRGLDPLTAVELPRLHRVDDVVHIEPTTSEHDETRLQSAGFSPTRWGTRHHYFGGVSAAGHTGAVGDSRRGGDQISL